MKREYVQRLSFVAELVTPVQKVYISKNHPYNRRFYPLARDNGTAVAFNCSVRAALLIPYSYTTAVTLRCMFCSESL